MRRPTRYVSLNGSAGRIWELFGAGHTADEVEVMMADEFDVERDVLAADVSTTLQSLIQRGLLEPSN